MFTFDWQIRRYLKEFNNGKKPTMNLTMLFMFVLQANGEGQFYPSTEYLANELGTSEPTIVKARKWLLKHGTFVMVPYTQRTGKMKDLPRRQIVYQLTGFYITNAGVPVPYLYMTPEAHDQMLERVLLSISETKGSETLASETLASLAKGISTIKGKSNSKDDSSTVNGGGGTRKRKRDELVDTLTTHLFKAKLTNRSKMALAGINAAWLRGTSTGTDKINVGTNQYPSNNPQEVIDFVGWWNETKPNYDNPTGISSFAKWWREWCIAGKPKPQSAVVHQPQEDDGYGKTTLSMIGGDDGSSG